LISIGDPSTTAFRGWVLARDSIEGLLTGKLEALSAEDQPRGEFGSGLGEREAVAHH
jgi:hypothetical protein